MRKALVFSIVLHLAVVVLAYFGVPMAHKEFVAGSEPVAVEFVTVSETTNLPPPRPVTQPARPVSAARVDPKPQVLPSPRAAGKPQPPAPPKPETAKVEVPPKAEPPVQAKAPVPEAKPKQVPEAKPKQVPEAKPKQMPEAKPQQAARAEAQPPPAPVPHPPLAEPKAAEPKLAVPKPAHREKPAPAQPAPAAVAQTQPSATAPVEKPAAEKSAAEKSAPAADFQSVLKTVDTLTRNEPQKPQAQPAAPKKVETEPAAPQSEARTAGAPSTEQAFQSLIEQALDPGAEAASASASASGRMHDPSQSMTVSEIDEVRRQIERCWNVPAGARDGGDHVVTIRVEMSPDATPRSAIVVNETSTRGNAFHRAAAESALRAVLNPRCHPFRLPVEKYDRWKTMTLVFDPKDMLGT